MGNFVCCLIKVVIFMGLERAYRLEGDHRTGASHEGMGPFFMGGVDLSRHLVNISILQL